MDAVLQTDRTQQYSRVCEGEFWVGYEQHRLARTVAGKFVGGNDGSGPAGLRSGEGGFALCKDKMSFDGIRCSSDAFDLDCRRVVASCREK
jgi:hypothetical protein